jgi:hypothetical protein
MRVMVWCFPPVRAGPAPQASRHNRGAEAAIGVGVGEGGEVVADAGEAADLGVGVESVPEVTAVRSVQAPTVAARPTLPASWSS